MIDSLVEYFLGMSYKENPERWREASPVNHVTDKTPPVFMYHGETDAVVEIGQMHRLEKVLRENHRRVETYTVDHLGHFLTYLFSSESETRGIEFLKHENGIPLR